MGKHRKNTEKERLLKIRLEKEQNNSVIVSISNSAINYEPLPNQEDALITISQYYFVSKRATDIKYNVGKYALLTTIAGTSVWLFGTTGGLAAGNNLILRILLITGGTTLNFCVSFNTSEMFLDYIKNNQAPAELKKFIKPKSSKLEMFAVGGAAFLSAGPTTLAVFSSAEKITALIITEAVVTQIDNTFIHTLPTLLIMKVPLLRKLFSLPFLPLIICYQIYKTIENRFWLSEEEKEHKKTQELKQQNHAKIKSSMINTLELARQEILKLTFQPHWNKKNPCKFEYKIELPEDLKTLSQLNDIAPLMRIASYAPQVQHSTPESLCSKVKNFVVNTVIGTSIYAAGAIFGNLGTIGYYKNSYDDMVSVGNFTHQHFANQDAPFTDKEALEWGLGLSSAPTAITLVLVGYFAGRFFRNTVYDSLISCLRGQYTAPQGFKRYPKTTSLLIGLAFFFAKYGYGTAYYLIQTHFQDAKYDEIRPSLLLCAEYGVPIFLLKNTIEVIFNQAVKFASFFGNDDNKASAELDARILSLENAIQNTDGDELEKSLNNISTEQREILLQMSEEKFSQLLTHRNKM